MRQHHQAKTFQVWKLLKALEHMSTLNILIVGLRMFWWYRSFKMILMTENLHRDIATHFGSESLRHLGEHKRMFNLICQQQDIITTSHLLGFRTLVWNNPRKDAKPLSLTELSLLDERRKDCNKTRAQLRIFNSYVTRVLFFPLQTFQWRNSCDDYRRNVPVKCVWTRKST